MDPLAREANETIAGANPDALAMLSTLGRELYFPKGILSQSAEAKKLAHRFNATIGTAIEGGVAMNLPTVMASLQGVSPNDALLYAPATGLPDLRLSWQRKILADNPSLSPNTFSLPVVTSGLTHGLSLVADLFVDPGDVLLLPDKIWGNYRLIFSLRRKADIRQYSFFKGAGVDTQAFGEALQAACAERDKVVVLLNFPNNPTGYSPTPAEGRAIAEALLDAAKGGTKVVVLLDDAYFGLFYDDSVLRESLFTQLAGAHPLLLAIKADAATKEVFVWGLRVGFLSYSVGGAAADSPLYDALVSKTAGAIRSSISNCGRLSQTLILKALDSPDFACLRAEKVALLKDRALEVKEVLANAKFAGAWEPYPFNSGYFMCLRLKTVDAEALRVHMLREHGVGTIAINDRDLRVAFSCLEVDDIPQVFDLLFKGVGELGG